MECGLLHRKDTVSATPPVELCQGEGLRKGLLEEKLAKIHSGNSWTELQRREDSATGHCPGRAGTLQWSVPPTGPKQYSMLTTH